MNLRKDNYRSSSRPPPLWHHPSCWHPPHETAGPLHDDIEAGSLKHPQPPYPLHPQELLVLDISLLYSLPDPLVTLTSPPSTKSLWKKSVKTILCEYWHRELAAQAASLPSLCHLQAPFLPLRRGVHPLWTVCSTEGTSLPPPRTPPPGRGGTKYEVYNTIRTSANTLVPQMTVEHPRLLLLCHPRHHHQGQDAQWPLSVQLVTASLGAWPVWSMPPPLLLIPTRRPGAPPHRRLPRPHPNFHSSHPSLLSTVQAALGREPTDFVSFVLDPFTDRAVLPLNQQQRLRHPGSPLPLRPPPPSYIVMFC